MPDAICSIRYPSPCTRAAVYGSWCSEHDPYRCGTSVKTPDGWRACDEHAPHIVAYSAVDTDLDRYFCDRHLPDDEREDRN